MLPRDPVLWQGHEKMSKSLFKLKKLPFSRLGFEFLLMQGFILIHVTMKLVVTGAFGCSRNGTNGVGIPRHIHETQDRDRTVRSCHTGIWTHDNGHPGK